MYTIFIVEDDPKILNMLQSHLEKYGYKVVPVHDFARVFHEFEQIQPDIVLLDINLPYFDGFYWCRQIRTASTCPILFISVRENSMDQVMALDSGADDYIIKPFSFDVIVAKIRSCLRRAYGEYALHSGERTVEHKGMILYPERLQATLNGVTVELSKKEALLLESLLERVDKVVSRERILEKLWDEQGFVDGNTLNVYITRVRKKLKDLGIEDALETVRSAGYRLNAIWNGTL
jgi:two-component system, OmpR family, response regulator YxdJ